MIPRTEQSWQTQSWQTELSSLITDPEQLITELKLPATVLNSAHLAATQFQLRVTRSFVSRIEPSNLNDPLLKQILPLDNELSASDTFVDDPLNEASYTPVKGIIHKYHGRVLMITATQCAINCRYCFRRNFPYDTHKSSRKDWQNALAYIDNDTSVSEVILSGGDPLVLADKQLNWLINEIARIPHVKRLRIHSRLPIVLPSRITPELVQLLSQSRLNPVVVIHCNHAQEIDAQVSQSLNRLQEKNIPLLNQTVLLKGINDDVHALCALSEKLFDNHVSPYYLHLLDKVKGASHFDLDKTYAKDLYRQLLARLPGYLVPKLVQEISGEANKTPIL